MKVALRKVKKILALGMIGVFAAHPVLVFAELVSPAFNANLLIPDAVFSDTETFGGPEAIQKFLESKGSILADTTKDFLLKLHEPEDLLLKQALEDPQPGLARPRTAAELIWDASRSSGINAQVILVTLNKEQGLITSRFNAERQQRALNHAMGFACPDGGGCDELLSGFYFQLFGNLDAEGNRYLGAAKSLMKSFNTSGGRGPYVGNRETKVGDAITLENTLGGYEGVQAEQTLTIGNKSTAALYRYTPHVFNGNYNFWKFFTAWFKYSNGTIVKFTENNTYYLIQKGVRRQLPEFVAKVRKLNLKKAVTVSPTELGNYSQGDLLGPPNNTIMALDKKWYLFIDGVKHPASRLVLMQKKLNPAKAVGATQTEAALFATGPQLLPADGTVLQARGKSRIYMMQKGTLKLLSTLTLRQYKSKQRLQIISEDELAGYPAKGYVAPLDGTLIKTKSSVMVYLVSKGQKRPLTHELFFNRKYKKSEVVTLSDAHMTDIPTGLFATPRENTHFKIAKTKDLYVFKKGAVHKVDPKVAKKRHLKARYMFAPTIVKDWPVGEEITK